MDTSSDSVTMSRKTYRFVKGLLAVAFLVACWNLYNRIELRSELSTLRMQAQAAEVRIELLKAEIAAKDLGAAVEGAYSTRPLSAVDRENAVSVSLINPKPTTTTNRLPANEQQAKMIHDIFSVLVLSASRAGIDESSVRACQLEMASDERKARRFLAECSSVLGYYNEASQRVETAGEAILALKEERGEVEYLNPSDPASRVMPERRPDDCVKTVVGNDAKKGPYIYVVRVDYGTGYAKYDETVGDRRDMEALLTSEVMSAVARIRSIPENEL
jgi:hypothetical protein